MTSSESGHMRWPHMGLRDDDRILVTGATGWFGRTMLRLLRGHPNVLAVSSVRSPGVSEWSSESVRAFRPTVVANFAFLTRDHLLSLDEITFSQTNEMLTERLLFALEQETVRLAVTVSSGAALDPQDLYGRLKAREEVAALSHVSSERVVVVPRVYSISGPYVRRPEAYALSSFVTQALRGTIHIEAAGPVYRRYSSVSDVLTVALGLAECGLSGVVESGGDLVEMQDLANTVRRVVNPKAIVTREPMVSTVPQIYASDDSSWRTACARVLLKPQTLEEQVGAVRDFLSDSQI